MAMARRSSARPPSRSARSPIAASTSPAARSAIRIYTPAARRDGAALPVVLQYHGGGFVLGDLDTHDSIARYYCAHADAVVVSVDYRLPPEHASPTVDDSYAALTWVVAHARELGGDPARLAVAGDSAGGNLADRDVPADQGAGRAPHRVSGAALPRGPTSGRRRSYASHAEFGGGELLSVHRRTWTGSAPRYFADVAPRRGPDRVADGGHRPQRFAARTGDDGGLRPAARRGPGVRRSPEPRRACRWTTAASTRPSTRAPRLRARFPRGSTCWRSWRTG